MKLKSQLILAAVATALTASLSAFAADEAAPAADTSKPKVEKKVTRHDHQCDHKQIGCGSFKAKPKAEATEPSKDAMTKSDKDAPAK